MAHTGEDPASHQQSESWSVLEVSAGPMSLAVKAALERFDGDVLAWIADGFRTWASATSEIPLHRCLGLPSSAAQMRRRQRDHWLSRAAVVLIDTEPLQPGGVADRLAGELDRFLSRGPWRLWRDLALPPPEATAMQAALFHVARSQNGATLTARHIRRLVKGLD